MINIFKKTRAEKGFTVIELVTAAFIFSILLVTAVGIYFRVVYLQRRADAARKVQENVQQLVESVAKDVRVSRLCPDSESCNEEGFNLDHPDRGYISFSLSQDRGVVVKNEGGVDTTITSAEVFFTSLSFITEGAGCDDTQPKVTIVYGVSDSNGLVSINSQTTITSRDTEEELILCN